IQVIETSLDLKQREELRKLEEARKKEEEKVLEQPKEQPDEQPVSEPEPEKPQPEVRKEDKPEQADVQVIPPDKPTIQSILAQYEDTLSKLDDVKHRVEKSILYTEIASELKQAGFHSKAIEYFQKSLMVQEENGENPDQVATIYDGMAEVYLDSGAFETSIETLEKSMAIKEESGDTKGVSENLNKIGNVYENIYDYTKAIDFYEKSAEVKTTIDDKAGLSQVMDNMGNLYYKQQILEKSIESYERSVAINEQLDNKEVLGKTYNKLGVSHFELGQYDQAEEYYKKSISNAEAINENLVKSRALNNLGNLNFIQNRYNKAINYYENAIAIKSEIDDHKGRAISYYNIGNAYRLSNQPDKAIPYFEQSRVLAEEHEEEDLLARNLQVLAQLYHEENNPEKASEFEALAQQIGNPSVDIDDNIAEGEMTIAAVSEDQDMITMLTEEIIRQKHLVEAEAERRAKENKINRLKLESQNEQIKRQRIFLASLTIVIVLVLVVTLLLRMQILQKKKANKELREKNELISTQKRLITDNILSARVIQKAAMPPEDYVKAELPEHFILNMPKDIVSGDFYWLEKRDGALFVAVADCTGHGVQGAVVSMLGIAALNEIVNKSFDSRPSDILNQLSERIKTTLHSENGESAAREGMDMALLKINKDGQEIEFSGAKNPLYLVRDGEVIVYKGNRSPIGYYTKDIPFTTQKIKTRKGDSLYIFSDGYIDQLGGKELKKFMARRFQKILVDINDKPMETRREILVEKFNKWKGEYAQVDDIMVMGISL
ncbi:MAG: tetratricopeptide repeat protein, partial [Bacteroidota bacterium]